MTDRAAPLDGPMMVGAGEPRLAAVYLGRLLVPVVCVSEVARTALMELDRL